MRLGHWPRAKPGSQHHFSKLTEDLVRQIRATRDTKDCKQWAVELGISPQTISKARRGDTWKHVEITPYI